jgi:hypothetical protein
MQFSSIFEANENAGEIAPYLNLLSNCMELWEIASEKTKGATGCATARGT